MIAGETAVRNLNALVNLAGSDKWHLAPTFPHTVAGKVEWFQLVKAEEFMCDAIICHLEDIEEPQLYSTDDAWEAIRSTVEVFAGSEDEILEWLGQ